MKILEAVKNDDGTVTAMVDVGRDGEDVGLKDFTYQPGDEGYDAALAAAETQTEGES